MAYYPSLTRVIPLTAVQRKRTLPVDGEVLVGVGSRVEPLSVVARAEVPGRYHILDLAQALEVAPESVGKHLRLRPGQAVKEGQTVARRRSTLGLFPRVVRAPRDGVVAAVGGGRVLLETAGEPVELRAYIPGTVTDIVTARGVVVGTTGALIQGVWGFGGESFGVLKTLVDQPDESAQAKSIDVTCHGAVLVGGLTIDKEALQQALELQGGDHVGVASQTVLGREFGVVDFVAGGQDHGAHVDLLGGLHIVVVYGVATADELAGETLRAHGTGQAACCFGICCFIAVASFDFAKITGAFLRR